MKKLIGAAILAGALLTAQALAQTPTPPAKCRVAEINPVTNHAHCIDPFGAPLDGEQDKPCQGMHQTAQWTLSNGCDAPATATPPPN